MHLHHWLAQAIAAHPDPEVAAIETRHLAAHITGLSPTAQRIHDPELEPAQQQALDALAARPDAHVTATDQSAEALAIAQENAHAHRLTNLTFLQADWLAPFAADCADLILSNPPYIAANDPHLAALTHEPPSALIAAADGYRDLYTIMQQAPRNLKPNGWLLMEHGWQQGEKLRARATSSGDWHNIATHQDYAGRDRITEMQKRG